MKQIKEKMYKISNKIDSYIAPLSREIGDILEASTRILFSISVSVAAIMLINSANPISNNLILDSFTSVIQGNAGMMEYAYFIGASMMYTSIFLMGSRGVFNAFCDYFVPGGPFKNLLQSSCKCSVSNSVKEALLKEASRQNLQPNMLLDENNNNGEVK